jgi:plasmid stability protein
MMPRRYNVMGAVMSRGSIRSTLYLEPTLHQALRIKAASVHRSMSELVNDAIRGALREDEEDLAAFAERDREQPLSYEAFLARLKADGTL